VSDEFLVFMLNALSVHMFLGGYTLDDCMHENVLLKCRYGESFCGQHAYAVR
jgi:hypothetical protein